MRCLVKYCDKPSYYRGMCAKHYKRWRKGSGAERHINLETDLQVWIRDLEELIDYYSEEKHEWSNALAVVKFMMEQACRPPSQEK